MLSCDENNQSYYDKQTAGCFFCHDVIQETLHNYINQRVFCEK